MARRRCRVPGCERDNRSRGLCPTHRIIEDRYGDPEYPWIERDRFFERVDATGDCWEWKLGKDKDGYGKYKRGNTTHRAHRFAWELMVGPIPDGFVIDHLCKNTSCVNLDHLEPVTWAENLYRGESIQAHHAKRVLCQRGHDAWIVKADGYRACRECSNERRRERRARAKETMTYR